MKRIYSILFASFSLLSWTSCSSYLEENPKDRLDEETAYSTLSDVQKNGLSGNIWLVSFKISYLCLPLFYETRTTPSCHPSGCAYRQL